MEESLAADTEASPANRSKRDLWAGSGGGGVLTEFGVLAAGAAAVAAPRRTSPNS